MTSSTISLTVTLTVDGDTDEAAKLLAEYLTDREKPYGHDYSYRAALDGWHGPYITAVGVAHNGVYLAESVSSDHDTNGWPTSLEDARSQA